MKQTTNQDLTHQQTMRAVLDGLQDVPLTLKGGTALLFCYNLDRHSEDLDFDSPIKLNLTAKITKALKNANIKITELKILKDTLTTSRYKLLYNNNDTIGSLKIEVKNNIKQLKHGIKINNINTYSISDIFTMKMQAANLETGRAKAKDLYDIGHILKNFKNQLNNSQIKKAQDFSNSLKKDSSLFVYNHQRDKILKSISLEKMAKTIEKSLTKTMKSKGKNAQALAKRRVKASKHRAR